MKAILWSLVCIGLAAAENGRSAWLRYAPLPPATSNFSLPTGIIALNNTESSPVYVAGSELQKGFQSILGKQVPVTYVASDASSSLVVASVEQYSRVTGSLPQIPELEQDGFWLSTVGDSILILGQNERGALYGAFEYLSMLAQGNFSRVAYASNPSAPIRWANEWDNLDGSIERGYAGPSIFFADGFVVDNLTRVAEYARLLASIRVNGIILNNVNANATLLSARNMAGLQRVADTMRPYGVQIGISLNFASPQTFGGLRSFDPLDASVISWWTNVTEQIYQHVPDFSGYLVKANSEGQPGPLTYNRTLAQGANLFAKALKPYGGIVMFRAFVYDYHLNESIWKADRANAAVEFFKDLDGKFEDNVVVQIKYGPIDFQVREAASPLFANLRNTSSAIELQVAQEYLGQQCHLVYLAPLWKEMLSFDMRVDGKASPVRSLVSGKFFNRRLGGFAAVVNVGTNATWLGSHLAQSNLYAYGRLAWDPTADAQSILQDWIRLTFGLDRTVIDTITKMSMDSWPAYENYTGNLGLQTLTDITGNHYGPNPASQDNNGWGQWTRADRTTIGMDRTVSNGTGFSGQFPPEVAKLYESPETTPDNLFLWFHHVPYTYRLHSGKTVIQHIYDAHYAGAATAQTFVTQWETLRGKIDAQRWDEVLYRQTYQAGHSIVWRDAINEFYRNLSGIPDEAGRVRKHPYRVEAESMQLRNYVLVPVTPAETASNYTAIVTNSSEPGVATYTFAFSNGTYDLAINYYDLANGVSQWRVSLNGTPLLEWMGDHESTLGHAVSTKVDGHSATRVTVKSVQLAKGDTIEIVGTPHGNEPAPIDYVSFLPNGIVD